MPKQINIETSDKTIQQCLSECLYEIPTYQRPYAWEEDQLADFWDDVVTKDRDYFLGATVTFISERINLFGNKFVIIDGQQRLTTATIALAAIRDTYTELSRHVEDNTPIQKQYLQGAEKTQSEFLVREDLKGQRYPVITRPESNYSKDVLNFTEVEALRADESSHRKIEHAFEYFKTLVTTKLEQLEKDEEKLQTLDELRANILNARLIQIELNSEEDGFLVFETLNTRGLDLELPDLIKNLIIKNGATSDADRRNIAERWTALRDSIDQATPAGTSGERLTDPRTNDSIFSRFIWQSWNSRNPECKEAELFKALKSKLSAPQDEYLTADEIQQRYIDYLCTLEEDAQIYTHLDTMFIETLPNKGNELNFRKLPKVVDSIRALKIFNVSVANSALLAAIRKYHQGKMYEKDLQRLTRTLEHYHFHYNALGAVGSNGGMRKRYNRLANSIFEAQSKKTCNQLVSELVSALRSSAADKGLLDRTKVNFAQLFYSGGKLTSKDRATGRATLIQYVLMKLAQDISDFSCGHAFNTKDFSIEHIMPISARKDKDSNDCPVYSLGNLTILKKDKNNKLGDRIFAEKRDTLRKANLLDDCLASWINDETKEEITVDDIHQRASFLREHAFTKVWTL